MRLEDICTVFTDGDWIESKDQSDNGIRLVQTGNIGEGIYLEKEARAKYISEKTFDKLKCTEIFSGDILVSRLPEPVGRACIIPEKEERMITAVDCTICRPDETIISKEYLCYFMRSNAYYTRLLGSVTGTTRKRISRKNLGNVELQVPPKDIQSEVVEQLDCLVNVIESRKKELQLLDDLIKARFVELFGDPNDTKRVSNNIHKIGELCDVTKLAGFEFTEYITYQDSGEIIMLRGLNCKQGKLVLDNVKYIDRETSHKLPRSRLYVGDILMTYAGTIGDVAIVDEDDKYHLAPNVAKISIVDKEIVNPVFLVHLFMYSHDYIMTFASQVAQASINMQKIRDFEYIIPSMEQQLEFEQFAKQVDKSKFVILRESINISVNYL